MAIDLSVLDDKQVLDEFKAFQQKQEGGIDLSVLDGVDLSVLDTKPEQGVMADVIEQIPVGIARAGAEFMSATNALAGWLEENVVSLGTISGGDFDPKKVEQSIEEFKAELPKADTTAGAIAGTVAQFAAPMGLASKTLKTAGMANNILRGFTAGAVADFTAFDAHEKRLSNMIEEINDGQLSNAVTRYLASDKDDTELEGRIKQVLEGLALGGVTQTLFDGIRMAKAGVMAKANAAKAEKVIPKVQEAAGKYMELGLNPQVATKRALKALKINEADFTKLQQIKELDLSDDALKALPTNKKVIEAVEKELEKADTVRLPEKLLLGIRERIAEKSPVIAHRLNQFEMDLHARATTARQAAQPFEKELLRLNKADQSRFKTLWLNENARGMSEFLAERPALKEAFMPVSDMMKRFAKDMKAVNRDFQPKEGLFLPRVVKDHKALLKAMDYTKRTALQRKLAEEADSIGRELTKDETTDVINKFLRTTIPETMKAGSTTHAAKRVLEGIAPDLEKYYADPLESLGHYITTMSDNIEKRRFLGYTGSSKSMNDPGVLRNSIGARLGDELKSGNITAGDANYISELLQARFGPGEKASARPIQNMKNFMYMGILSNPVSAATQLGDVALAAHVNGIGNTVHGLFKTITRRGLTKEDIGIMQHAEDMMNPLKSHRWLDKTMKYSLFQSADNLGKGTVINGSLNKYRKLASTAKGKGEIMRQYKGAFTPEEMSQAFMDLQAGRITPNVKYMLWNDLTKMQPVSMSELPESYLRNPNGRVLYALKTFTVKQLNRLYFDGIQNWKKGNYKKGTTQMMQFAGLLTAGGMATDTIKDMMQNREPKQFDDVFISNLIKVGGTSDYVVSMVERGDLRGAAYATIAPPLFPMTEAIAKDLASDRDIEQFKSLSYVPVIGRLWHQWIGGGAEAYNERQNREQ